MQHGSQKSRTASPSSPDKQVLGLSIVIDAAAESFDFSAYHVADSWDEGFRTPREQGIQQGTLSRLDDVPNQALNSFWVGSLHQHIAGINRVLAHE